MYISNPTNFSRTCNYGRCSITHMLNIPPITPSRALLIAGRLKTRATTSYTDLCVCDADAIPLNPFNRAHSAHNAPSNLLVYTSYIIIVSIKCRGRGRRTAVVEARRQTTTYTHTNVQPLPIVLVCIRSDLYK